MRSEEENEGWALLKRWWTTKPDIRLSFHRIGDAISFDAVGKLMEPLDSEMCFVGKGDCEVFLDLEGVGFKNTVTEALLRRTGLLGSQSEGTQLVLRTGDMVSLVGLKRTGEPN
jgi:hypothetical protein